MQEIIKLAHELENELTSIYNEIEVAQDKGFVYARAKNIRKFAQSIKLIAHDLRQVTTDEFKNAHKE